MKDVATFKDFTITPEALELQAQVAESAGRPQIGRNMRRAAELTRIADERVLEIYNALRPHRSTFDELIAIADELDDKYQAHTCAAHVREATDVYRHHKRKEAKINIEKMEAEKYDYIVSACPSCTHLKDSQENRLKKVYSVVLNLIPMKEFKDIE